MNCIYLILSGKAEAMRGIAHRPGHWAEPAAWSFSVSPAVEQTKTAVAGRYQPWVGCQSRPIRWDTRLSATEQIQRKEVEKNQLLVPYCVVCSRVDHPF